MRATSSFTHTGSVVLIRLVTSNSLRRKFMRLAFGLYIVDFLRFRQDRRPEAIIGTRIPGAPQVGIPEGCD
jgi:hypothetical protein